MTRNRTFTTMIAAGLVLAMAVPALAFGKGGSGAKHPFGGDRPAVWEDPAMATEMNLTQEQIARMTELHNDFRTEVHLLSDRIKAARFELETLLSASKIDERAYDGKIADIVDLQTQRVEMMAGHHLQIRKLLSDEQYEKLTELRESRRAEFRANRRGGQGRGQGRGLSQQGGAQ